MENKKTMLNIAFFAMILFGCMQNTIDKSTLLSSDYRLFQDTPAWTLAKSVRDGNIEGIKLQAKRNRNLVNYSEPIFGKTLLMMAVYNRNYNSVKTLLEEGADPNKQDKYDGTSALMEAAQLGRGYSPYPAYLRVLIKYGGDPNAAQKGGRVRPTAHFTPLWLACHSGILEYVKILVEAGADVNSNNKEGGPLYAAIIAENPDIVLYLLKKGANYKIPMFTTAKGDKKYILDAIKNWKFEKGSDNYQKQMTILNFLKEKAGH